MNIVIYHNPACGTSRNVLKIIRNASYDPTVVEYIEAGWTEPQLLGLFAAVELTPREALRTSKSPADELGLLDAGVGDAALIAAMVVHPVLVNRPIVACAQGVRLCPPSDAVLDLLPTWPKGLYYKEDGDLLIDADGNRADGL